MIKDSLYSIHKGWSAIIIKRKLLKVFVSFLTIIVISSLYSEVWAFSLKFHISQDLKDRIYEGHTKGVHLGSFVMLPAAAVGIGYGVYKGRPVTYGASAAIGGFALGYFVGYFLPSLESYPGIFITRDSITVFLRRPI